MQEFISRAQCALHAIRSHVPCFKSVRSERTNLWHYIAQPETNQWRDACTMATTRDFVHHIEQHDGKPVFVVTCLREEILEKLPFKIVPITRSLWAANEKDMQRFAGATRMPATEKSARMPGATKRVWEIADANPGVSRQDLIALCGVEGINAATAGTQISKWKRSKGL